MRIAKPEGGACAQMLLLTLFLSLEYIDMVLALVLHTEEGLPMLTPT